MRLTEGVSVFQLAADMGTSVEMLEDFYGKKRMRDPRMHGADEASAIGRRRLEDGVARERHVRLALASAVWNQSAS